MNSIAQKQFDALAKAADEGIPACYVSMDEFFTDFWMDFSWNKAMKEEVQDVLDNPHFTIINNLLFAKYNFDVRAELIKGRDFDPESPYYS